MGSRRYTVAELFSGCGGFTYGFVKSGRFSPVLANDIKGAALATYKLNNVGPLGKPEIVQEDLRTVRIERIVTLLKKRGIDHGELDILIGGPPCQGFSQLRRGEKREGGNIVKFKGYDRLAHDPRNDLVLRFLEVAEALRPRFIVIENVPQILSHSYNGNPGGLLEAIEALLQQDLEYSVSTKVINAADFGVPQTRQRAFIIASRDGKASFPDETHFDPDESSLLNGNRQPWVTVGDAIKDLPAPPLNDDKLGGGPVSLYPDVQLSTYAEQLRSKKHFPYNHVTRQYSRGIMRIIKEMRPGETWDYASERMRQRYEEVITRQQKSAESREEVMERLVEEGMINPRFYKRYYWSAYTRLTFEKPALTITANANFLGSGRFTHPDENRGISMREAARLQSFDDDFRFITSTEDFEDTTTYGVGFDMIGEAVPPLLSRAIAKHIARLLDELADGSANQERLPREQAAD